MKHPIISTMLKYATGILLLAGSAAAQPKKATPAPKKNQTQKVAQKSTKAAAKPAPKATPTSTVTPAATPAATPTPAAGAAATKCPDKKKDKGTDTFTTIPGMDKGMGDLPTYIKSNQLELNTQARTFTYSGNVEVRHGDMTLTCDFLDGNYNESNKIQQLAARSNVIITKGDTIRATGAKAIYDAAQELVTLTDSPELQQDQSVLTADAIKIFLKDNRSVADGTVRVKMIKGGSSANVGIKQLVGR